MFTWIPILRTATINSHVSTVAWAIPRWRTIRRNFSKPPRAIKAKKALVGRGAGKKEQVAAMVVHALRLRSTPSPEDVTDALALAIAHARRCSSDLGRGAAAR